MPLMDEFKEEREEIKNASFKKKSEYFWEYYKWWVISIIIILIAAFFTVRSIVTRKNDVLYVALINAVEIVDSDPQTTIIDPFLTEHEYELKKNTIHFDFDMKMNISSSSHASANTLPDSYTDYVSITNSATSRQNLSIYIAAGTVDLIVCSENWFDEYAYGSFFVPLTDVLTEAELEKYSENLFYVDEAVLDRYTEASEKMDYDYNEKFPDSYDIEAMERPIAVGLIVDEQNLISSNFAFATEAVGDKIVVGFIANGRNLELAHDLVIMMMNQ